MLRLLGLLALLLVPGLGWAAPELNWKVQPVHQDDGNQALPFSVECSSQAWTTIVSSSTIRRSILIYSPRTNPNASTDAVCISTITSSFTSCVDGTAGVELTADSALTDYSKVRWNCRGRANTTDLHQLKGYENQDRGDHGNIGNPVLQ